MIRVITAERGEDAKKLWAIIKEEVDKARVIEIDVEHDTVEITGGLERAEIMYTGEFTIKLRCQKK